MKPLGDPIGVYGIGWPEVLRQYLTFSVLVGVFLFLLNQAEASAALAVDMLLALWLGVFLLLVAILSRKPRIVIYEHGIGLRERDDERGWRWEQITRWDGQRSTFSYEGIPILRYGANHFYAGDERLFSVSVLRDRADQLASYSFAKMTQTHHLPGYLTSYHNGGTLRFDGVTISKTGLGGNKQSARWDEIEALDFKNDHLRVKRYTDRKLRKFGYVSPANSYGLMGLLDRARGTDFLARKQTELLRSRGQIWAAQGRVLGRLTLILSPLIVLLVAAIAFADQSGKQRHDGLIALNARYGSKIGIACAGQVYGNYRWDGNGLRAHKFLVIDMADSQNPTQHAALQAALPEAERATSAADLTTVVCLWPQIQPTGSCPYGNTLRRRYRQDYVVALINIVEGSIMAEETLFGGKALPCPQADPGADLVGALPSNAVVLDWLHEASAPPRPPKPSGAQL